MKPFTLAELRAMDLKTFRLSPLPEASRDFGHDPVTMLRASDENAYAIVMQRRQPQPPKD